MPSPRPYDSNDLRRRLIECPPGRQGWRDYEEAALDTLTHLFVPPLVAPRFQARTFSGIDRRDAVFPNRITDTSTSWGLLRHDLNARLILFEFKNFDASEIGKEETDQTRNYLKKSMGQLAVICCNKKPNGAAHVRRNSIYSEDGKVILFITTDQIIEMIDMKDRGEDPGYFIVDSYERFLIQHE